jgi:hypothetical protein
MMGGLKSSFLIKALALEEMCFCVNDKNLKAYLKCGLRKYVNA